MLEYNSLCCFQNKKKLCRVINLFLMLDAVLRTVLGKHRISIVILNYRIWYVIVIVVADIYSSTRTSLFVA